MTKEQGEQLLEAFFAPPNELRLAQLTERSEATSTGPLRLLNQFIEDIRTDNGRPALLPRADTKETVWYALLPNRRLLRLISEDIKAFIGATYADLDEMSRPLSDKDPIDAAVLAWVSDKGAVLRFKVALTQRAQAIEAIGAMRRAWDERPPHLIRTSDATAPMLRALNRAIASDDGTLAEAALDHIRSAGRLSTANLTFSTIRVLEVAGQWKRILELDELALVLAIPRPRAVTEALLRAVYWCKVADGLPPGEIPDENQLTAAVAVMSRSILPPYAGLFRAADGLRAGEALLLFALRAAAAVPPRIEEIERLAEQCNPNDPARPSIQAIEALLRERGPVVATPSIEAAFAAEAVKAELHRAVHEREGRHRDAQAALEAFGRGPSIETASNALDVLSLLSTDEVEEIQALDRYQAIARRVRSLSTIGTRQVPDGWLTWARGLHAQPEWPGAVDVLELAAESWALEPILDTASGQDFAITLMDARSQGGRGAVARALDYLLPRTEAAVARSLDVTDLSAWLITMLLADDVVTEADWNFVVSLLGYAIDGTAAVQYAELVDEVRGSLFARASPATLDASLATLEAVAFRYAPDQTARDALASVVIGICDRFSHRLHRDQLAILEIACKDLGGDYYNQSREFAERLLSDPSSTANAEPTLLNGQSVGIYTLDVPAALRAKTAIESAYTGVRVETNAAEVATQSLRHLAQTADFMIVATRTAKHAATLEIDAILRMRGVRPVFPAGKGATSIVRALRDRLAEV